MEQVTQKQLQTLQNHSERIFFLLFESYKMKKNNHITREELCAAAHTLIATSKILDQNQYAQAVSAGKLAIETLFKACNPGWHTISAEKLFESGVGNILLHAVFKAVVFAEEDDLKSILDNLFSIEKIWTGPDSFVHGAEQDIQKALVDNLENWNPAIERILTILETYQENCGSLIFRLLSAYILKKGTKQEIARLLHINIAKPDDGSSRRF